MSSGVARAFPGGRLAHPENQNEEENKSSLRKNKKNWSKFGEKWGKCNSCPPGTVRLATAVNVSLNLGSNEPLWSDIKYFLCFGCGLCWLFRMVQCAEMNEMDIFFYTDCNVQYIHYHHHHHHIIRLTKQPKPRKLISILDCLEHKPVKNMMLTHYKRV